MIEGALNAIFVGDDPENHRLVLQALDTVGDHGVSMPRFDRFDEALEYSEKHVLDTVIIDLVQSDFKEEISLRALPSLFPELPIVALISTEFDEATMASVGGVTQDYLIKEQLNGPLVLHTLHQASKHKASEERIQHTKEALEAWVDERTRDLTRTNKALIKEIEERKRAEQDLAESRRMLSMITNNIPALVALVDKDRRYVFANQRYERYLSRSVDKIVGVHVSEVLGDIYETKTKVHVDAALKGLSVDYELDLTLPDTGEIRWLHVAYIPSFDEHGDVDGYFVLGSDITERKQTENSLREHRELLQNILDGLGAAVFFIDMEGFWITDANEIAETMVGLPRREIVTMRYHDLICRNEKSESDHHCVLPGVKSLNTEYMLTRPDGTLVPVTRSVLPVTISGRPHQVAILFDITDRKAMERQLAFAQKLESVGQLAAGIAHEINTPIQYIGNNLQFIKQVYEQLARVLAEFPKLTACIDEGRDGSECSLETKERVGKVDLDALLEEVPQALKESLEGVERVASIVLAMKKFSHPDVEDWKQINLNDAVRNTVTITRNEWKHAADMELDLDEGLPLIAAVPGDINQVILNLIVNATHAIQTGNGPRGGKGSIVIATKRAGEDGVELTVSDTGTGIPEEDQSRIFDPFFTTKEVGKGTGQGLAITLSVIEKHDGSIDFESEVGRGTTFHVRLPIGHANKKPQ